VLAACGALVPAISKTRTAQSVAKKAILRYRLSTKNVPTLAPLLFPNTALVISDVICGTSTLLAFVLLSGDCMVDGEALESAS
jgi:hypothetical protein